MDLADLKPGNRVRVMVTGQIDTVIAEVTDRKNYGWPVLRVVDPPDWPPGLLLKCEDYIPLEFVP